MSYRPHYDKGDWIAICDVCGRKYKASMLQRRWDGLMCCPDDWETRHPQDFVRGVPDPQAVGWTRDEPQDQYTLGCSTRTSIVGYASAGCAITANKVNPGTVPTATFNQ